MILKNVLILLSLLVLSSYPVSATNSNRNLQKIGEGTAYYLKFIKVYDASLYGSGDAVRKNILSSNVSKCLHLDYDVDINKNIFIESATESLNSQFPAEVLAKFSREIELIHQSYQDVQKGDSYTLCYISDSNETTLAFNGSVVAVITSPGFAEIYFSIWLGETDPLDKNLRYDLLSG